MYTHPAGSIIVWAKFSVKIAHLESSKTYEIIGFAVCASSVLEHADVY